MTRFYGTIVDGGTPSESVVGCVSAHEPETTSLATGAAQRPSATL